MLPQTQCGKCGYPGCRPYADAIVCGEADINQCPPGGDLGVRQLAELLGREPKPINPANGVAQTIRTVALIDEALCIGCLKCIAACPVDAILGAAQQMHTVIAAQCTGCELCIPPCPVDCIRMEPVESRDAQHEADAARARFEARQLRLAREEQHREDARAARKAAIAAGATAYDPLAAALARARAKP